MRSLEPARRRLDSPLGARCGGSAAAGGLPALTLRGESGLQRRGQGPDVVEVRGLAAVARPLAEPRHPDLDVEALLHGLDRPVPTLGHFAATSV